jgi:hypothetical protein
MHYVTFRAIVRQKGWTLAQLRCDVRPSQALTDFMSVLGLECYENYVLRLEREERRQARPIHGEKHHVRSARQPVLSVRERRRHRD